MSLEKTGILFFSRNPYAESRYKILHADKEKNFQSLNLLINWTKRVIKSSGIPYIQLSEKEQQGESFGEKMVHAMNSLFSQGYEQVIIVGNDCPRMELEDLLLARNELDSGNSIIGRNAAGGAYLFGIHKRDFHQEILEKLPWNSPHLGQSLLSYLKNLGEVCELDLKEDINDEKGLRYMLGLMFLSRVLLLLRKLFRHTPNHKQEIPLLYLDCLTLIQPFRGPPSVM